MIGGSQVASWEVYPRKHADPDAKKQMAGAGSSTGERASFNYGQDMCGNQSSSALQFGVSRGRSEVLLSGYGRAYRSEIVSKFDFHTGADRSRATC